MNALTAPKLTLPPEEAEVLRVLPGLGEPKYPEITAIDFHTAVMAKHYGADYRETCGED